MSSSNVNRIWSPSVKPTSTSLPEPVGPSGSLSSTSRQEFYTKTSLSALDLTKEQEAISSRNRQILSVSQAFNDSPKPFETKRQSANFEGPASLGMNQPPSISFGRIASPRLQESSQIKILADESAQAKASSAELPPTSLPDLSPKVVHKQYNSPLDLYSMSNIRKTIEAHTELLAPGIKGINFMKPDTPVNKQSEVYKLIREEEERERRSCSRQSTSKDTFTSNSYPPSVSVSKVGIESSSSYNEAQKETHHHHHQQQQQHQQLVHADERHYQMRATSTDHSNHQEDGASQLACPECGRPIIGPFARVGSRSIHAHCFNCTTCGTSLKNNGFFTINDKLYCDIHAKQVANMMRIRYDFEAKQNCQSQSSSNSQAAFVTMKPVEVPPQPVQQQQVRCPSRLTSSGSANSGTNLSSATISTMFADRSHGRSSEDSRYNVDYSERSHVNNYLSDSSLRVGTTTQDAHIHHHAEDTRGKSSIQMAKQDTTQLRQSIVSSESRGQSLFQDGSQSGERIPVCKHCRVQIQGPYILAGATTWCKYCSQTHFNCDSCKRSLLDIGFIEDNSSRLSCEYCFEAYYAPVCFKCNIRIKGDCLNALNKKWHPSCFVCGHCRRPFGNSSFYLEDNVPYCERDWKLLFTTKCCCCSQPIEAGDRWIEALDKNYHTSCFKCTACQTGLEGSTFYCKGGKPYCRMHAR